jgi:putative addiction module component (TIGR02574 family)
MSLLNRCQAASEAHDFQAILFLTATLRATLQIHQRNSFKGDGMNEEVKAILKKIMELPQQQRAFIAERLILSLDAKVDRNVEKAWQAEIQKRMSGEDTAFLSWEDVKNRLKGE